VEALTKARRARNKRVTEALFSEGIDEAWRTGETPVIEGTGGA
jgi:hypothetical protein